MDFDLTDEQRLIKQTAREFTDKEIVDRARENARNHHFDLDLVEDRRPGLPRGDRPARVRRRRPRLPQLRPVVEEIGRGDSAIRTVISVQTSLVCSAILKWGTEEQKQHYLPKLCSGEWLGCFGLTEPDTGSDAANQRTRARKTDCGWVINGAKMWISMGNYAKVALIFAQTDPELGHRGLGVLPGRHRSAGLPDPADRAQDGPARLRHRLDLTRRRRGRRRGLLGEIGEGFKVAMSALDSGRYSVAAGCVGICQGCVEESVKYSKEREQFGRPIASFQLVQAMIADMVLKTDASRMLVWRAGFLKDKGRPNTLETSIAKLHATEASARVRQHRDPGARRRRLCR